MNQKQTNKRLTELKAQYANLIKATMEIEDECLDLLGCAPDSVWAFHWTVDYLNGMLPQRDLLLNIKSNN